MSIQPQGFPFSAQQVRWAQSHDWFVFGDSTSITCREEWFDMNEAEPRKLHTKLVTFTNFRKLRAWAGY